RPSGVGGRTRYAGPARGITAPAPARPALEDTSQARPASEDISKGGGHPTAPPPKKSPAGVTP
ncbi:hypothetical protein ADL26_20995, partial [Thermoactinomyces vulgaris]